jgi:uronate dehydrogenase
MSLVLVTGATGEVGRGVLPWLEKHFSLRLLSLDPPGDDPRRICADLLDWNALSAAVDGVESVLHLAIAPGHSGVYEDDAFNDRRFGVNVKGTFHVFEAARRAKVRRVVNVSSLMVVWGYGKVGPVPGDAPPRPVGTYALTKTLTEEIGRHYAEQHNMEVITVRISAPLDIDDPQRLRQPVRPQQIPLPDLAQAFVRALTVPLERYEIVTIVGESSRRIWDLAAARRVLGYQPRYRLDDFGVEWADPFAVEP